MHVRRCASLPLGCVLGWLFMSCAALEAPEPPETTVATLAATADATASAVLLSLGTRASPAPGESLYRWDLATATQVAAYHDAARARVGASKDDAMNAAVAELAAAYTAPPGAAYDPLSAPVLDALGALNASSAIGVTPLFDKVRGEVRMVFDLAWFARGSTPEDAALAYLGAHETALKTLLGLGPTRELFLAGANDHGDTIAVAFRSRCNGVEVAADAFFLNVTTDSHWLGAGVVDSLYATLAPGLDCPYTAADLIDAPAAIAAALAAVPSTGVGAADCNATLRLRRDAVYFWSVHCPFPGGTPASIAVDATSAAVLGIAEPDYASGWVAGNLQLGGGTRLPNDVVDDYPAKFVRVFSSTATVTDSCFYSTCTFVDDADATGAWTTPTGTAFKALLASPIPPPMTYSATGVFRSGSDSSGSNACWPVCCTGLEPPSDPCPDNTATLCTTYALTGAGGIEDVNDDNPARMYYLLSWLRERYSSLGHEVPQRLGFSLSTGFQSNPCGVQPAGYFLAGVFVPFPNSDGNVKVAMQEHDHTWEYCSSVAGWGCAAIADPPAYSVQRAHLAALKHGHSDYVGGVLVDHRLPNSGDCPTDLCWDDTKFYVNDTDVTDWFVSIPDVATNTCTSDANCGPAETCINWGATIGNRCGYDCADYAFCVAKLGPGVASCGSMNSFPGGVATNVCTANGYVTAGILTTAMTFLSARHGPMYGFDIVADGYELGWSGTTTTMAGPTGGDNLYAKIWSASGTTNRHTVWRAFSPVFDNLTNADAGDDYGTYRPAGVIQSIGNLTTTINYGSAYGDSTANIDFAWDRDYFIFKAAEGETYTVTMTSVSGGVDSCLIVYSIASGGFPGYTTLASDTDCGTDGTLTSVVTYTVPFGATYDWILIDARDVAGVVGTYSLALSMNGDEHSDYHLSYPTWQDAWPLAANGYAESGSITTGTDYDWFKVYVPNLAVAADLKVTYSGTSATPTTYLYRGCTGSGGPASCGVTSGSGTTFCYPVSTADDNQWYYILVGAATTSYSIDVDLRSAATPCGSGAVVADDWSDNVSNRYPLQFGWGDMVAGRLTGGDVDGFRVTLTRGDRFTVDVHPALACDTKVAVIGPVSDYFLGKPFVYDDENNSADGSATAYGDQVSFVADVTGDYLIDISAGPGGCFSEYVAYFHEGPVEYSSNLPPPFDPL